MLKVYKFFGTWCGPCKVLAPQFDRASETFKDNPNVEFYNIDVDIDTEGLAGQYGVMGVPAVLLVKDNEVVDRFSGFRPQDVIEEMVQTCI